jgi:hypothetical protein
MTTYVGTLAVRVDTMMRAFVAEALMASIEIGVSKAEALMASVETATIRLVAGTFAIGASSAST